MIGGIVPRPIAWVSTRSADGVDNLAPFSFFAGVGSNPMTLLFCPANRADGTEKDSLRNAKPRAEGGTGEFVVQIVPVALAREMAASAAELEPERSEFDLVGLERAPSVRVSPPRVRRAMVAYECVTEQVIRTNPGAPGGGNIVIGRVVLVHVADEALGERGHIRPEVLDAVGRMGGTLYCRTRDRFELPSGESALGLPPVV